MPDNPQSYDPPRVEVGDRVTVEPPRTALPAPGGLGTVERVYRSSTYGDHVEVLLDSGERCLVTVRRTPRIAGSALDAR